MPSHRVRCASSVKTWKAFDRRLWECLEPYSEGLIAFERAKRRKEMGLPVPLPSVKTPGREAVFLRSIWFAHHELTESRESLQNIPACLTHLPRQLPRKITRYAWVRYHAENYFQELYVFQNRVEVSLRNFCRSYRKHAFGTLLNSQCEILVKELKRRLEGLIRQRGEHCSESIEYIGRFQVRPIAYLDIDPK